MTIAEAKAILVACNTDRRTATTRLTPYKSSISQRKSYVRGYIIGFTGDTRVPRTDLPLDHTAVQAGVEDGIKQAVLLTC